VKAFFDSIEAALDRISTAYLVTLAITVIFALIAQEAFARWQSRRVR
jgi:hypothetical protein